MKNPSNRIFKSILALSSALLLGAALTLSILTLVRAAGPGALTRLTTASHPDRDSRWATTSQGGDLVVFRSNSDFLAQGLPANVEEIWLYDSETLTFTRVTSATNADRLIYSPYISADGSTVVFTSDSDYLGQGIPAYQGEIWRYDTAAQSLSRLTTASSANRASVASHLSPDGKVVAFYSDSDILGQGLPNDQFEVWLYNLDTQAYTRVTTASDAGRDSYVPKLNADGSMVVFHSDSDLLNQGLPDGAQEVWLYDTQTLTYTRITSRSHPGRYSSEPRISADGSLVAFYSDSDLLGQGLPQGQKEIFTYQTATGQLTRITYAAPDRSSYVGGISPYGRLLVFASDADLLNQGVPDNQFEVWLYDTQTLTFTRLTTANDPARASGQGRLSPDGLFLVFTSDTDFNGVGIPDDQQEIWMTQVRFRQTLPLVRK